MPEFFTHDEQETRALAAILSQTAKVGDIFTLSGDLGAGKSAFARGFIQSLLGNIDVPSPTFTLVQNYEGPNGPLYHFDLYRLENPHDVLELGWDEALAEGICLIEWPDKAGDYLPYNAHTIVFTVLSDTSRKIVFDDIHAR